MHRILCPNSFLIELERKELSEINGDLREGEGVHFLGLHNLFFVFLALLAVSACQKTVDVCRKGNMSGLSHDG